MTESDDDLIDVEAVDDLTDIDSVEQLNTDDLPDADELDLAQLGPLVELAKSILESVTEGEEDPNARKVQALLHLVNLIQGVLTTTDTDELLDTVDLDELDSVVDLDSLPAALESGDVGDAIEFKNLRKLIEFGQLWDAVDVTELMGSKDEITDTIGSLTGDEEGEGGLFDGMEMEEFVGGDDGQMGSLTEPELIQTATQAQLDSAIDGFRDLLVETHARLDELREANKQRFDGVDQPSSRNPTAVSTLTTHRGPPKDASRASTVPRNVRHSTGPSRRRIYGRRFKWFMEEKQADQKVTDKSDAEETANEETEEKTADETMVDDGETTDGGDDQ